MPDQSIRIHWFPNCNRGLLGLVRHRDCDFSPRALTGSALLSLRHCAGLPHSSCAQPSPLPPPIGAAPSRALRCAWRERASCEVAAFPSPLQSPTGRQRSRGIRLAAGRFRRLFPWRRWQFHPRPLALESPMAIACLAERAPCFPSRTCSISSRTYSACVDADFATGAN